MANVVKTAYDLYKKDIISGILFSLAITVMGLLFVIPVIGAIIYSFVFPRLLVWYYQKLSGEKLNPNYKVSFISIFIPSLILSIGIFLLLLVLIFGIFSYGLGGTINSSYILNTQYLYNQNIFSTYLGILSIVIIFIGIVIYLFSLYSFYGSLFGKVDKYKLDLWNSIEIFVYYLSIGLIVSVIFDIIDALFSLASPIAGFIIGLIFLILFGIEIQYLVPMVVMKNL
ncbi:hypothetical protein YN1_4970 [Nanoarchaeota archaeon]